MSHRCSWGRLAREESWLDLIPFSTDVCMGSGQYFDSDYCYLEKSYLLTFYLAYWAIGIEN
jgi:hypothetical protein